jgi:hypothetical protein
VIVKNSVGVAVWEVKEVRSLFGGLRECDHFLGIKGVRSLFGKLKGCDRCLGS